MSSLEDSTPEDDPALRDALKRCSPATYYAACKFKKSGHAADLSAVVIGIMERFTDRDLRPQLAQASDSLRLREDLGLDSLTMMEIVMVVEEIMPISVSNEELTNLRTLGDVQAFVLAKSVRRSADNAETKRHEEAHAWDITAVGEDVRRIEAGAAHPISPLSNRISPT